MRFLPGLSYTETAGLPQLLDLYLPEGQGPFPTVVSLHGGAWKHGTRAEVEAGFLVAAGIAVASVSYRLSGVAPFPAMIQDCRAAVRWLRSEHRRHDLMGEKIGAMGASAGGHLAALLGLPPEVPKWDRPEDLQGISDRVQAVVSVSPVTDVRELWRHWESGRKERPDRTAALADFCGGPPADHLELMRVASPLSHVRDGAPAMLLYHGRLDPVVPISHSQRLAEALQRHAVPVELISADVEHDCLDRYPDPEGEKRKIAAFFNRHLR